MSNGIVLPRHRKLLEAQGHKRPVKSCPFCGSADINTEGPCYTQFMCNGCGASTYDQSTREEAVAAWNNRVQGDAVTLSEADISSVLVKHLPPLSSDEEYWSVLEGILNAIRAKAEALSLGHPIQGEAGELCERLLKQAAYLEASYGWTGDIEEAASIITTLVAENERLTEQYGLACSALDSMRQNRDTVQRHLDECTIQQNQCGAEHGA